MTKPQHKIEPTNSFVILLLVFKKLAFCSPGRLYIGTETGMRNSPNVRTDWELCSWLV